MAPNLVVSCLLLAAAIAAANAQSPAAAPASSTLPAGFGQIQAELRSKVDTSAFVTSFDSQSPNVNSSYGSVRFLLGQNSPALATLANAGLAQGVITLQSCALWAPHIHPRANEILYVSQGNLSIAFHEENAVNTSSGTVGGRFLNYNVPDGSSIVIPQGLLHYAYNPSCSPATVVTSFDNRDPGSISIAQQFFNLPTAVVSAATGLQEVSINLVKNQVAQTAIISIDPTCLAACGKAPSSSMG